MIRQSSSVASELSWLDPVRDQAPGHMSSILVSDECEKRVSVTSNRGSHLSGEGQVSDLMDFGLGPEIIFNPGASLGRATGQLLGSVGPVVMALDEVEEASAVTVPLAHW